jgi:hypothetical protein
MLGPTRGFFAHLGGFRCGSIGCAREKPGIPGKEDPHDGCPGHQAERGHALPGFHEPLSEFCSQSRAPLPVRRKK